MIRKVILLVFIFVALFYFVPMPACTSVIVSGRITKDGRPIILKNRDTGELSNMSILVQGEKYRFVGIVNAKDTVPREVWGGHNEAGFAIMNTAAYNLNKKDQKTEKEGILMKRALEVCATLQDFDNLLDTLPRPLCVDANFGVLDARGGCAYYEIGDNNFVKFDANDPKVAPDGYLMRTNFGMSGDRNRDQGVERFYAISELMRSLKDSDKIDVFNLLQQVPRYLKHGLTHLNLYDFMPTNESETTILPFRDFIPRYITASCLLVQGVKATENPCSTVSWTIVGYPLTTVAVPIIITPAGTLPSIVARNRDGKSTLAEMGLKLKDRLFSEKKGNRQDYINVAQLINKSGTGILQKILPIEKEVFVQGESIINQMREGRKSFDKIDKYYKWVDQYVLQQYKLQLNVK